MKKKGMKIINSALVLGIKAALCAASDPQLKVIFISRTSFLSFLCISPGLQSSDYTSLCLQLQAREQNKASASTNSLYTRFQVFIRESPCQKQGSLSIRSCNQHLNQRIFRSCWRFWMNESFCHNWTSLHTLSDSVFESVNLLSWPRFNHSHSASQCFNQ